MKTAIIIGATGLTGSILMDIILNSDVYEKLIVFVRKDMEVSNPILEQHIINFEEIDNYKHLIKGDELFCCLGTTIKKAGTQAAFSKIDMEYPIRFATIAQQNGVKHFLMISSIGANPQSSTFYLRTKGLCEQQILEIPFSQISIFRPSALVGKRKDFRIKEYIGIGFARIISCFLLGKLKKYKPIESSKVAISMYNSAQRKTLGSHIFESDQI